MWWLLNPGNGYWERCMSHGIRTWPAAMLLRQTFLPSTIPRSSARSRDS